MQERLEGWRAVRWGSLGGIVWTRNLDQTPGPQFCRFFPDQQPGRSDPGEAAVSKGHFQPEEEGRFHLPLSRTDPIRKLRERGAGRLVQTAAQEIGAAQTGRSSRANHVQESFGATITFKSNTPRAVRFARCIRIHRSAGPRPHTKISSRKSLHLFQVR